MRRLIICAVLIAALCGCTAHVSKEETAASALDTASVIKQVGGIYARVINAYDHIRTVNGSSSITGTIHALTAQHCSADWQQWVARVENYDKQHNDGMVGFFEADYWIMGQDWHDLSVSDVKVRSMTDTTATVELNLHNCGNVTAVQLQMVRNEATWKIYNFIDETNDIDWKASMKTYLNREGEHH